MWFLFANFITDILNMCMKELTFEAKKCFFFIQPEANIHFNTNVHCFSVTRKQSFLAGVSNKHCLLTLLVIGHQWILTDI